MSKKTKWMEEHLSKGIVRCSDEKTLKAVRILGYHLKIAPKVDLDEDDQYLVLQWILDLLDGDLSLLDKLIAPKHVRDDPDAQYATIVQALLQNPPRQIRRRYLYWLEIKNRERSPSPAS